MTGHKRGSRRLPLDRTPREVPGPRCDWHSDPSLPKTVRLVLDKMPPSDRPAEGKGIRRACLQCRRKRRGQYIYPTDEQIGYYLIKDL